MAANPSTPTITFTAAAGCTTCRTLVLNDTGGNPLNSLDLSHGSGSFIADVKDQGINPAALGNFDVESTLSNLYLVTGSGPSGFNCNSVIPSGDVSLNSLPSLLDANSLSASLQPVFTITSPAAGIGGLLPAPVAALGGIVLNPTFTLDGVATTVNQAAMAGGSTVTDLLGPILTGNSLPVKLSVPGVADPRFANPASPPSSIINCPLAAGAPSATPQPVLHGVLNGLPPAVATLTNPLLTDLSNVINPTNLTSIIPSQVDAATALNAVATATKIPVQDLATGVGAPFPSLLASIEGALTATVTSVLDSATQLTGNYGATPAMAISQSGATPGSYEGVLTVTMTSGT